MAGEKTPAEIEAEQKIQSDFVEEMADVMENEFDLDFPPYGALESVA